MIILDRTKLLGYHCESVILYRRSLEVMLTVPLMIFVYQAELYDAGTDNGFTFTSPNWPTEPQGVVFK